MTILGISAFYHDSAAAIIKDGKVIAAAQEERFSRKKNDAAFPRQACIFCLKKACVNLDDLDAVVFYDKPFLKFERLLETYYQFAPKGVRSFINAMPVWLNEKLFLKRLLRKELSEIQDYNKANLKLLFTEHHLAHAASAFFASPFEEAAILTIDGVGEWSTASLSIGKGNSIKVLKELHFPHSLGLLYSAFTYFLGFKVNGGEYKLMGLAPYGNQESAAVEKYKTIILDQLIDLKGDGSLWLNQKYFSYATDLRMVKNKAWKKLFGFPKRMADTPLENHHCDLALAIQQVTEIIVLKMAKEAKRLSGAKHLCMAGGVALNCVANGKLVASEYFEDIFIQPAAGDAGGALGAALATHYIYFKKERNTPSRNDSSQGVYYGPSFEKETIRTLIKNLNVPFTYFENFEMLCEKVSKLIANEKVVGWFQGRMEFGPRALGNRSILGDPRSETMQRVLNLKIKNRESFRPFAPAVLEEDLSLYFDLKKSSPYMLLVAKVKAEHQMSLSKDYGAVSLSEKLATPHSSIPAVTHVDFSSRIQTVTEKSNLKFWQLLQAFKKETGLGMLINTSFNVKDEPIVCSPEDAYRCFLETGMDVLVLGDFVIDTKLSKETRSS